MYFCMWHNVKDFDRKLGSSWFLRLSLYNFPELNDRKSILWLTFTKFPSNLFDEDILDLDCLINPINLSHQYILTAYQMENFDLNRQKYKIASTN